jgi:hypothetical protein
VPHNLPNLISIFNLQIRAKGNLFLDKRHLFIAGCEVISFLLKGISALRRSTGGLCVLPTRHSFTTQLSRSTHEWTASSTFHNADLRVPWVSFVVNNNLNRQSLELAHIQVVEEAPGIQ